MIRASKYLPVLQWGRTYDGGTLTSDLLAAVIVTIMLIPQSLAYGPHKTLYNRFIRWSRLGVFDRIFAALSQAGPKPERIMIDATHLKAHRTAASLLKKGMFPAISGAPRAG